MGCQMDKRETNSDHEIEKRGFANLYLFKNVLRQLLFLEIFSVMKIKTNCLCMCIKRRGGGGRSN